MTEEQRIREQALLTDWEIRQTIRPFNLSSEELRAVAQAQLDKALKAKGIRIESDDQSLPDLNLPTLSGNKALEITMTSFAKSVQNNMLKPDSEGRVWKKVEPKEGK